MDAVIPKPLNERLGERRKTYNIQMSLGVECWMFNLMHIKYAYCIERLHISKNYVGFASLKFFTKQGACAWI